MKRNGALRRKGGRGGWRSCLQKPFTTPPQHIPDDQTMDSGLVTSRRFLTWSPVTTAGSTTTHNGGMIMFPHPLYSQAFLVEAMAGYLTDVTNAGWFDANGVAQTNLEAVSGVPNVRAIIPLFTAGRVRCVGMGLRVTYEGTELNRSGRYWAGLCPISSAATGWGSAGTAASALSVVCTSANTLIGSLKNCMTNITSSRVADGTFEYCWLPNGVPSYQGVTNQGNSAGQPSPYVSAGGSNVNTVWNTTPGAAGNEVGQNALVFWVEGDTTSSASLTGNTFTVEHIYHWEVVPSQVTSVAYSLTPSTFNPSALAAALNLRQTAGPVAHTSITGSGSETSPVVVRVTQPSNGGISSKVADALLSVARDPKRMADIAKVLANVYGAAREARNSSYANRMLLGAPGRR